MDIGELIKQYPDLFEALVEWYRDPKMEFSYFEIHRAGKIIKGYGGKWGTKTKAALENHTEE